MIPQPHIIDFLMLHFPSVSGCNGRGKKVLALSPAGT